jgi:hypothetical protein
MKNIPIKKEILYYGGAFILSWMVVGVYGLIQSVRLNLSFVEALEDLWVLPFLVLVLLVVYETLLGFLIKKQEPKRNEKQFNMHVSTVARQTLQLEVSDFQTLRQNERFQIALSDVYRLFINNPHDTVAFDAITKRFNSDPFTQDVIRVIVEEAKFLGQDEVIGEDD